MQENPKKPTHPLHTLAQQLQTLTQSHPPPAPIQSLISQLAHFAPSDSQPSRCLPHFIDSLCDEVLKLNNQLVVIANLSKDEEIEAVLNKFVGFPHEKELEVDGGNDGYIRKYRAVVSQFFHYILHHNTLKSLPKLCVLFYKLLSIQMLQTKVINFFFLILILSHENVVASRDMKVMKTCLRSLYVKSIIYVGMKQEENPCRRKKGVSKFPVNYHLYESWEEDSPSFTVIAYVVYFGNGARQKQQENNSIIDKALLSSLLAYPNELSSLTLAFRNEFPDQLLIKCHRNMKSLSECIIDSYILKTFLRIYLDFKLQPQLKQNLYQIIKTQVQFNLNVHTVKNMIKILEIGDLQDLEEKWKKMFFILRTAVPAGVKEGGSKEEIKSQIRVESPNRSKEELSWDKLEKASTSPNTAVKLKIQNDVLKMAKNSYLNFTFQHEFNGFQLKFRSYRTNGQFIMFKLKNEQQQIWAIARHLGTRLFQVEIMRMSNNSIDVNKIQVEWQPLQRHKMTCNVKGDQIHFQFLQGQPSEQSQTSSQDNRPLLHLKTKNIRPKTIQLGSNDPLIPCYFTQLSTFDIYYCQGKNTYNYIKHNKHKLHESSHNIKLITRLGLVQILKKLGDLDLFFLICSHLIRKVDGEGALRVMLKEVNDFLELLVVAKGVHGVRLSQEAKEHRFYNVRFLVWLASKYKRDPEAILQIFRLLQIRGIKKPLQTLQILSNIGLWKQTPQKSHLRLLQKIKQTSSQIPPERQPQLLGLLRKIMLDYMIFYKNNQLLSESLQSQYLIKQAQILRLVFEVVVGLGVRDVLGFIQFLLKILYILLDRTKNSDYIDTSIGFQVSLLAYRLLTVAREAQFQPNRSKSPIKKSMKMTKSGLTSQRSMNVPSSIHFNKEQEGLVINIEETLVWANEIVYCLTNQLLHAEEKIKYYDWDWGQKEHMNSSIFSVNKKGMFGQRELKVVGEDQILKLCQKIRMGLLSYNRSVFNLLNCYQFSEARSALFWDMNLFDPKISNQRLIDTLKFGHFETIVWNDQKITFVLEKSFDLSENSIPLKLPQKLLTSMKTKDINLIHNSLLGIYYDKCQQANPLQKQKCAQKIMYIISILPDSLYSNTHFLREQLRKDKRNLKMVELVEKHLIVKELAKEGFKLMKQIKMADSRELYSTIVAFDENGDKSENSDKPLNISLETEEVESKKSKERKNSEQLAVFSQLDNVDFQQSFWQTSQNPSTQTISNQKIKQSLQHLKLLANPGSMQTFYKVPTLQNRKDSKQQIEGYLTNFNINIDAIMQILQQSSPQKADKLAQLQSYIFFIEKHLYSFSKMIIADFLFTEIKEIKVQEEAIKGKRKRSFQAGNFKFKEVIQAMLEQFLRERRIGIYKTENVWFNVQRNNKDLWEIFFKSEKKNQSVDVVCNALKLKGLIKIDHEKREIQLPKNMTTISNKFSISGDSDKDDPHSELSESTLFQDVNLYNQQQPQQPLAQEPPKQFHKQKVISQHLQKKRHKKDNQFPVSYITTTVIYQGVLACEGGVIRFVENLVPNQSFYDLICANQNQQRTAFQIEKRREMFEISLNQRSTIIPKKYLYHDAAVQIFSQRKTSFFVFGKGSQRQQFLKYYEHIKGAILNEAELLQTAQRQMERWAHGDISNYTYLMHVNDLAGRTFNDMSQYYIFPWVLTNYKSQKFNKKFLHNEANYRDLSKPVGALNPKRFEQLETRFKQSTKYNETESYLYGSFCSNPAIVCNYLVRLQPFSMHHYLLQSKQFDLADRIFYSVANQFNGCYTNIGDYKELIPEFYSCPEFLRNRNKYKFGEKQNKEIVNNVELPEWALYEFGNRRGKNNEPRGQPFLPEQQFVFRMRKCLESQHVTQNINSWLDLIFGIYNRKQRAMQRNNLYISNIYKNELKKGEKKNKQMLLIFFKEFGQIPRDLFEREHKCYRSARVYYKMRDGDLHAIPEMNGKLVNNKKYYADSRFFVGWNENFINIVDIKNKTGLISTTENSLTQIPLKSQQVDQVKILSVQADSEQNKKLDLLLYLKQGKLYIREMSISTFRKKLEVKDEKENFFNVDTQFRLMEIYEEQKFIVFVGLSSIKIYQYSLQANSVEKSGEMSFGASRIQLFNATDQILKILLNKKYQLRLNLKFEFTQHKSRIDHISICQSYGLLISVDSNRKVYILKINSKQIEVVQYFRLKKLTNCEQILEMQVHDMGYILVLTTQSAIHVYNLMGDYVGYFNGGTLREVNRRMCRKVESSVENQLKSYIGERYEQNLRKKSGNDIATGDKPISCEIQESDADTSSIMVSEEQPLSQNLKPQSSIPHQNEPKLQPLSNTKAQDQNEQITSFKLWNQQSLQLIIGTNAGNVYRFDFFMVEDCEKIDFGRSIAMKEKEKEKKGEKKSEKEIRIQFMSVNRIGRHWQCWVASSQDLFKLESEDYRNADKRNQQYKKKYVLQ